MMFSWILILVICLWAIWYFLEKDNGGLSKLYKKDTPIDILKRRFAKGEITEEEYEERKAVLEEEEYFNIKP